jgi:hypothetical protein
MTPAGLGEPRFCRTFTLRRVMPSLGTGEHEECHTGRKPLHTDNVLRIDLVPYMLPTRDKKEGIYSPCNLCVRRLLPLCLPIKSKARGFKL